MLSTAPRGTVSTPIQYVKGVGPSKADALKKLGIHTVEDLFFHFPREHQDRRIIPVNQLIPGRKSSLLVNISDIQFLRVGKMLGQAKAHLRDQTGAISAVWFKYLSFKYDVFSSMKRDLIPGARLFVYGSVEVENGFLQIRVEDHEVIRETDDDVQKDRIVPVYPATEGIQDKWLRALILRAFDQYNPQFVDPLPQSIRETHQLPDLSDAIRGYHFPLNWSQRDHSRHRLAFDEFFQLELALAINRQERQNHKKGRAFAATKTLLTPFKNSLPYEFTKGQARAINEIFRDMAHEVPMNRLLQGDVGSGKTVVALSAALLSIENAHQVVLLAPTEILAEQHFISIRKFFGSLQIQCELLTKSTPSPRRKRLLAELKSGKIQLLIGTHSILNDEVLFHKLGLVIIDEQHRFGVRQRAKLTLKTQNASAFNDDPLIEQLQPDVLIMTATPIPRTLALTLYGDLDVSIISEMPAERLPIETHIVSSEEAMRKISERIKKGEQAYIVFPLIEESEKISKKIGKAVLAAKKEFENLKKVFPSFRLGLLHGQMPSEEKNTVMKQFRNRELDVLIATPVIEVGIDVPNATIIVIMSPERFGLAQLHQLRGRVGRGTIASECLLVRDELESTNQRLDIFSSTTDGFRLAEEDLKLRGPGEFIGEAQHGVPFFRVGNLIEDGLLIAQARQAAQSTVEGHFKLTLKESMELNKSLRKKFGNKIKLSHVG